jgi:hypothetical protein
MKEVAVIGKRQRKEKTPIVTVKTIISIKEQQFK